MREKFNDYLKSKVTLRKSYVAIGIILVVLISAAYFYFSRYFYIFHDPKKIKDIIMAYGSYSVVAFLVMQAVQVIIFFIPGEVIQIAGGYVFGIVYGSLYSLIGITAGSAIAYGVSWIFGKPLINKIVAEKHIVFFDRVSNLGNINQIVFFLYLVPGIPKDVLAYICGISDISFKNFILYSTLGRIPAIIVSAYFGSSMYGSNYKVLIFIAVIMIILFAAGILKGEKFITKFTRKK